MKKNEIKKFLQLLHNTKKITKVCIGHNSLGVKVIDYLVDGEAWEHSEEQLFMENMKSPWSIAHYEVEGDEYQVVEYEMTEGPNLFKVFRHQLPNDDLCGGDTYETHSGACFAIMNEHHITTKYTS